MREILFRGKRITGGEWMFGLLADEYHDADFTAILPHDDERHLYVDWEVDPATVGQYTGLKDKNGKRIFEGDIVRDMDGTTYPVVWGGTGFYLRYDPPHAHGMEYELLPLCNYWHAHGPIIEVIGNIHDNPELMDGGAEE